MAKMGQAVQFVPHLLPQTHLRLNCGVFSVSLLIKSLYMRQYLTVNNSSPLITVFEPSEA